MRKETYETPSLESLTLVSDRLVASSPLSGSTENLWNNSSFESPKVDNGGEDLGW